VKERIFKTVWELRKRGYAEATVEGYSCKLKVLSKIADLNNPERVREVVALKKCSVAFKEALVNAYDHYVKVHGLVWTKPFYARQRALPYIASAEQINQIISRASRRYALVFSVLRDTGLRPVELYSLALRNVDLEKGVITPRAAKAGNPRALVLKPSTLAMLNEYVHKQSFGLDEQLFPSPSATRHAWERYRNDVAKKLHQPELRKIRLYDLRHFFATMLYHRTKDILYVKEQLGHRRIENTLIYTHLVNWGSDEYVCKVAKTAEEAKALVEQSFDYVLTSPDGCMLFRKLK
jgi:integrase